MGATQIAIGPRLSVSIAEAAVWASVRNFGVTWVLHHQCATALRHISFRLMSAEFEWEPLPVYLIHVACGDLQLKMRVFLDFAVARMRDMLKSL